MSTTHHLVVDYLNLTINKDIPTHQTTTHHPQNTFHASLWPHGHGCLYEGDFKLLSLLFVGFQWLDVPCNRPQTTDTDTIYGNGGLYGNQNSQD
jgi:hypothetical protein